MNKEESIKVLEQALNIASNKGCYNLQNSAAIYTALNTLADHINYYNSLELINYAEGFITRNLYERLFSTKVESEKWEEAIDNAKKSFDWIQQEAEKDN